VFVKLFFLRFRRQSNLSLQSRIAYRHEMPWLEVGAVRSAPGGLQAPFDHCARHRPRRKIAHSPASCHFLAKSCRPRDQLFVREGFPRRQRDEIRFAPAQIYRADA
jgi:hypothetical protein